jgi:ribokinase
LTGKIVVLGIFVYDLIVWLPYFPRKGETLLASAFKMYPEGKGFNQAVSARRCGALVSMVGKVEVNQFGDAFLHILEKEGIDHHFVIQDESITTGLGIPMIDPQGDNSIIGVRRANTLVTPAQVNQAANFISPHDMLLIQMKIPLAASLETTRIAHASGRMVIFNPAPAAFPLVELLPMDGSGEPLIDWLMPNEVEAEMLSGIAVKTPEDARECGKYILAQGVKREVVIALGSKGAVAVTPGGWQHVPSFQVKPVDSTGAGDAFCGAFTTAMCEGISLEEAFRFANAARELAVTVAGAEPSLPGCFQIDSFVKEHG